MAKYSCLVKSDVGGQTYFDAERTYTLTAPVQYGHKFNENKNDFNRDHLQASRVLSSRMLKSNTRSVNLLYLRAQSAPAIKCARDSAIDVQQCTNARYYKQQTTGLSG